MPRRPPPGYYEEDEIYDMEPERGREHRPHRRDHEFEDVEYRRRKSEPLAEDMERMHIRERPRRDFMEENFERPRGRDEMMPRRPREEVDMGPPERSMPPDDIYMRPPGPQRRPRPPQIDEEDLVYEERATRRGSRRQPREFDEEMIIEEREKHMPRMPRPERDMEQDLFDEEERPRRRRHRPRRESEEELILEERERGGGRSRRPVPDLEEEDRAARRGSGLRSRKIVEEDLMFEDRDLRRRSRRHPERRSEDDLLVEERERRRGDPRHPERRSEDDLLYERSDKRHRRRRPERAPEQDLVAEEPRKSGRRRRPEKDFEEEETFMMRKGDERSMPRGWGSERDMRPPEKIIEFEEEERYRRPRPRPPPSPPRVEVEEVMVDEGPPGRHPAPVGRPGRDIEEEEMIMRWKGKGPRPVDPREEELVMRERRERRRSPPSEDLERELRGLRRDDRPGPPLEEGRSVRSNFDSIPRPRDLVEDEEDIHILKTKDKLPPRPPSPDMDSIHVPPIHQDVFTHHRHIDHGYGDAHPPKVPTPEIRSRRGSPNEIDIHHRRMRGRRMSEEDIVLKGSDSDDSLAPEDSISPTGQTIPEFKDPWDQQTSKSRSHFKPMDGESESSFSRGGKTVPSMRDMNEIDIESTRTFNRGSKGTDDWSVVHAPSKADAVEMSGALDVVEVEPRHPAPDVVETGRVSQQVHESRDPRDDKWTEITKKLVVKEAIEQMGYEYEETRTMYYIFSYLNSDDIDELVELSDEIRSARRRRIRDMQRERESIPPPAPPRMRPPPMGMPMPPRARMMEKRMQEMRDREWMYDSRR